MSNHPYAGERTLTPGETASDDPVNREKFCQTCDEHVTPVYDTGACPTCGEDVT